MTAGGSEWLPLFCVVVGKVPEARGKWWSRAGKMRRGGAGKCPTTSPRMLRAGQSGRGGVVLSVGGEEQPNEVDLRRGSLGSPVCCDSIKVTEGLHNNDWL